MLRKLITFAILALTAAFAPSAQVARSQFTGTYFERKTLTKAVVRPSAPTRTIAEEVEVLVSKSLKKAEMRLEVFFFLCIQNIIFTFRQLLKILPATLTPMQKMPRTKCLRVALTKLKICLWRLPKKSK